MTSITSLRSHREPNATDKLIAQFSLPKGCALKIDVNSVVTLHGREDSYAGRLYLFPPFLCFMSLDQKSVKFTLPLSTIRRVERLNSRSGVFALSIIVWHGTKIIIQITSLRPAADQFSAMLRDALKAELQQGSMKLLKPFVKTLYSEVLIPPSSSAMDKEREDGSIIKDPDVPVGMEAMQSDYHGGLGFEFKFPGDAKKLRESSKLKLWATYLRSHGRHLTLLRYPQCTRLIQVGLPNRLRGELWETLSGSLYLRLANSGLYEKLLKDNEGRTSTSTEDIEKDLSRSLPEYPAYQTEKGIDTLRKVLTAYSWKNPEVGYCQAMNILAAAILIFMSEEQAFWLLEVLCDRLLPGYYSPSMWGTILDQRVFEALVHKCLPLIHDRFHAVDVQLSVASLPWFLSLFINSMPLIYAFRIIDCFFAMGPKVLFQVGTAILKINGPELLEIQDDGSFINLMRDYFNSLGDSAHPDSVDPRVRAITNFQELLLVSFREFSVITEETIAAERKRFRTEIVSGIESFTKRAAVRNLKTLGHLDKVQAGMVYDVYFQAICDEPPNDVKNVPNDPDEYKDPSGRPETRIGLKTFKVFLSQVASWARDEVIVSNGFQQRVNRNVADHELIDRLFFFWDFSHRGALSFQDLVVGLSGVMFNDLMANIEWFFTLHDKDKDGALTKDEVLQLAESLLFIFRHEIGDTYLGAVSRFMTNAFEYGDALSPQVETAEGSHNLPYLTLPTFRMVVLADEVLESFFDVDLSGSFRLEPIPPLIEQQQQKSGFLGGLVSSFLSNEDNRRIINNVADQIGKTMGKHQVVQRPSIGKYDKTYGLQEPKPRESLLTPSIRNRSPSGSSLSLGTPEIIITSGTESKQSLSSLSIDEKSEMPITPIVKQLTSVNVMERKPFAIDEAKDDGRIDDDLDSLDGVAGEDDKLMMDEVDAFLEAHDSGLTNAENEAAKGMCPDSSSPRLTDGVPHIVNSKLDNPVPISDPPLYNALIKGKLHHIPI
ncbi:rab-GTPase-TBC domain-containing protein [Cantharellus anzutake]|uniref:rab-GTPase-TBC domain-containing protein n=1 Tax=Cantharellus anzutake TaxID=1750568 RepID=UPI001903DF78|nr:rab-GTPase-TBC domain-containing protein [Cantharellus anzutake]KAF8328403.1 rab-GTPase-TBC domain-containing protein [Cantharellus anzutake]